jgi:phenylacetic acid degradation protein
MTCYAIDDVVPVIEPGAFVHPDAVLIGDVIVETGCYIGPVASLRGDFGRIIVGAGSNVQDSCVLHAFPGKDCVVEAGSHVAHGAILHGCRVRSGAMVGMSAVVMDGVTIGERALVAACSFVPGDMQVPPDVVVAGVPATVRRPVDPTLRDFQANGIRVYQDLAQRSLHTLRAAAPLQAVEEDRRRVSTDATASVPLSERRRRSAADRPS